MPRQTDTPTRPLPLRDAALAYAAHGWRVVPLYPVRGTRCTCPDAATCKSQGKHSYLVDWPGEATTDATQIHDWWRQRPSANVGIVTGTASGIVVMDVDPRHQGDINLEELQQMYRRLPETPMVLTGGGGQHYYFACTEALPSCDLAAGINFQTERRLVVAPPSHHASGRDYAWEASADYADIPLAPLPDWVRALALSHADTTSEGPVVSLPETLPAVLLQTLHCSARIKAVIQTGIDPDTPAKYPSRSEALFAVILALIHGGHDDATIASVVLNPAYRISDKPRSQRDPRTPFYERNIRAWMAKEIMRARAKYQTNGHVPPLPDEPAPHPELWRQKLLVKKNGDPTMNMGNIGLLLTHHPRWATRFWWDTVRSLPMYNNAPVTDELIADIAQWLGVEEHMSISNTKPVRECVVLECHKVERDLLREWLESLPAWDGVERLDYWLHDVAETENTIYGQIVSRMLPVSMVARALHPGCQYRYVVILQGPENTGKSSLVIALASPAWYVELTASLESKESHMTIQGAWLAEMAELDSLNKTTETRLKAFITLREDSWIPKYSNFRVTVPRRTILIGTTNEGDFLRGLGNTRYLPIKTGSITVPVFEAMREQVFAEALTYYQAHLTDWWVLPKEALDAAIEQREERRLTGVYESALHEWLEQRRFEEVAYQAGRPLPVRGETTWEEIAQYFLKLETPEKWKDMNLQKQIATDLKTLGWARAIRWRNGKTVRVWARDG